MKIVLFLIGFILLSCNGNKHVIRHFDRKSKFIASKYGFVKAKDTTVYNGKRRLYYIDSVLSSYEDQYRSNTYIIKLNGAVVASICRMQSDSICFPIIFRNLNW